MIWKNKGHEYEDLENELLRIQRVYLWGIGKKGKDLMLLSSLIEEKTGWEICAIDSDERINTEDIGDYRIHSPKFLYEHFAENSAIVVVCPSGTDRRMIISDLQSMGIKDNSIVTHERFLNVFLPVHLLYKGGILFFPSQNILPSNLCNLNCEMCLNFYPYIKKITCYSLEEVKKDIDYFFFAVDLVLRFEITGGEPFLYKYLIDVLGYIDDQYRDRIIRLEVVTNGTVIPSEDLCQFLAQKEIYVILDDYTDSLNEEFKQNRKTIEERLVKHNVWYRNNKAESWIKLYPVDREEALTLDEKAMLFDRCNNPFSTIEKGCISLCNYNLYAQKAGLVQRNTNDFYDITRFDKSKKAELMEFRLGYSDRGYSELCGNCYGFCAMDRYKPAIQVHRQ